MISNGKTEIEEERVKSDMKKISNSKNILPQLALEPKVDYMRMQNQIVKDRPSTTTMNFAQSKQPKEIPKE